MNKIIYRLALCLMVFSFDVFAMGGRRPSPQFQATGYVRGRGGFASSTSGISCGGQAVPVSVRAALDEVKDFARNCSHLRGFETSGNKIAINDYSGSSPRIYIFDPSGSNCLMSAPIAYGGGGKGIAPPVPCSGGGQKLTPPGIHITSSHNGKRYNSSRSIGLVGLSGQGSVGRAVIIHPKAAVGAPSTWGCTGIQDGDFQRAKQLLGEGSLVHNYFGSKTPPGYCSNFSGTRPTGHNCRVDPGGTHPQTLMRRGGSGSFSPSGPRSRGVR